MNKPLEEMTGAEIRAGLIEALKDFGPEQCRTLIARAYIAMVEVDYDLTKLRFLYPRHVRLPKHTVRFEAR